MPNEAEPAKRRRPWRLAACAAVLLAALLAAAATVGIDHFLSPWPDSGIHEVVIDRGTTPREIGERLERAGILRHRLLLPLLLRYEAMLGRKKVLRAGRYRFPPRQTPWQVIERLTRGGEPPPALTITIPEGLRLDQVAKRVESCGLGKAAAFMKLASDPGPIRAIDPEARDLEGYLYPDTYQLRPGSGSAALRSRMIDRFRQVTRELTAGNPPLISYHAWVTMASLVERETALPRERPLVSSVYWNRLHKGILLQCDPTVIYAMVRSGLKERPLLKRDLAFASPYNTYQYKGLPPGPIASPGRASLAAALSPASTDFLYFVADGRGGHSFSRTLREHERAVRRYHQERRRNRKRS